MKNKKAIVVMWILSLLPFGMIALAWPRLPDQIPLHWGLNGEVNGWGSPITLLGLAAIGPALALFLQFLPRLDPKKRNYEKFQDWYDFFCALMPLIMVVTTAITLSEAIRPGRIQVGRVISILVALLFLVLGNMMGKVKTNWFMGIRTPWALSDPDVWNKTQRLGGRVFFASGLLLLILAFVASEAVMFVIFFAVLFLGIAVTYFMSWKWFQEKQT